MTLITDRTMDDVRHALDLRQKMLDGTATADEETEYLSGTLKGTYNASDMNRVANAARVVADAIGSNVIMRNDWPVDDIPTPADLAGYIMDLSSIRSMLQNAPAIPESIVFDFSGANAIEEMLVYAEDYIRRMQNPRANLVYSGGIF